MSILVYRGTQENWAHLAGHLDPTRPGYSYFLQETGLDDGSADAGALLFQVMESQTAILTHAHTMEVLTVLALCGIPLILFLRTRPGPPVAPGH